MITTRQAPRTRRLLAAAFVLSVLIHLFGGALWAHGARLVARVMQRLPEQHQREQDVATSDVVHLEKRAIPRPAQRRLVPPQPRPQRIVRPRPADVPAAPQTAQVRKPEVKHPAPKAEKPAPRAPVEVAHLAPHAPLRVPKPDEAKVLGAGAPPSAAARKAALSAARLAQLNAQFAKTIASTHVDLATIQKKTEERPVAVKHYPMQFAGVQADLQRGEGYISPTTAGQRIGNTMWYYTHYTYMWPDGHLEDDDIPWPFRFPVQRDLFALHVHLIPLQLPPPGFHLNRPLKPFLAHFLQSAGSG